MGILVSESQERMIIAVKPEDYTAFEALADLHEVEATAVATFTSTACFTCATTRRPSLFAH